jgi:hypothetical protein
MNKSTDKNSAYEGKVLVKLETLLSFTYSLPLN